MEIAGLKVPLSAQTHPDCPIQLKSLLLASALPLLMISVKLLSKFLTCLNSE